MDLQCPYCNADLEVCHDDGFGYAEGVKHQMECYECNKNFVFETTISFYYDPEKADCLNGSPHEWKLTKTTPVEFSQMYCTMCDEHRELTDEERKTHSIGTKESFYESLNNKKQ